MADFLGVSYGSAHNAVKRARDAEPALDPEGVRADLSATLDRSLRALGEILGNQDVPPNWKIQAASALVAVVKEKADLHGAHAPVRRVVEVHTVSREALDAELERLDRELTAAGIDVSALPGPEEMLQIIDARATSSPVASRPGLQEAPDLEEPAA